jgi:hypothetical protein
MTIFAFRFFGRRKRLDRLILSASGAVGMQFQETLAEDGLAEFELDMALCI